MVRLRYPALSVVALASVAAAQAQQVGNLTIIRQVKVTPGAASSQTYVDARNGQRVSLGQGLRTLRRSTAQINFDDRSILRVNERTDLTIVDAGSARKIALQAGAVWIKVAKGVNTTVQTPTATATARGTAFEVRANGDLLVYEGTVDMTFSATGQTVSVSAGQKVVVGSDGKPSEPTALTPSETPTGKDGGVKGNGETVGGGTTWFGGLTNEGGTLVFSGTQSFVTVRSDPVNEGTQGKPKGNGDLGVIIRGGRAPGVDPKRDLPLVDDTETSYLIPALALGASYAADHDHLNPIYAPAFRGTAFAFAGTPSFAGLRGDVEGMLGDSRYSYEANVIQFYHEPSTGVLGRFGSVLYLERPMTDEVKVFAGRRRFYHGPVFNDTVDTQLIADRFSAVGFHMDKKALSVEGAYVYDANKYVPGAQSGGLASVFFRAYGGVLGGHFLETSGIRGGGHGRAVSLSMPILKNQIDGYGEFGNGIDGTTNETAGAYFPGFFQKTGVDIFFEYGRKRGVQQAYSLTGMYAIPKGPLARASLEWVDGASRFNIGLALKF